MRVVDLALLFVIVTRWLLACPALVLLVGLRCGCDLLDFTVVIENGDSVLGTVSLDDLELVVAGTTLTFLLH